jgi:glutamate-1-semialdehyde 2,1-aminomutase
MTFLHPDLDPAIHMPLTEEFVGPTGSALLPGGYGRGLMAVAPWAPMVARGDGCWIWDEDGRRVLDMNNNFTTNVLGNAHPAIVTAVQDAAGKGLSFGMSNRYEIDNATLLLQRMVGFDQVRYVNSGTEATMLAVRIARAATGKDKIVVVRGSYHGWNDAVLPTGGANAQRGVPAATLADTLVVPFDDVEALRQTVQTNYGSIAAILLDLLPNRVGMTPPSDAFVTTAVESARAMGAALIVDEVISLRLHTGGLTTARGIPADMVAMGKMIGGGMPVGAVVGKEAWMNELNALSGTGLEGGGTFSANPLTMAAGTAVMENFGTAEINRLAALGDRFRDGIRPVLEAHGWYPRGQGSLTRLFPLGIDDPSAIVETQRRLWWAAYDRGVLIATHGVAALSTPMTEDEIDAAIAAFIDAVPTVQKATSK